MKSAAYRRLVIAALLCYWLAMFIGTHIPEPPRIEQSLNDKYLHFGASLGLAFLICLTASRNGAWSRRKGFLIGALVSAYGIFDETTQLLVDRDCDPLDWMADTAGAIAGVLCFHFANRLWTKRLSRRVQA